jgi:uncharacterized protein YheU (UPF0270 family)
MQDVDDGQTSGRVVTIDPADLSREALQGLVEEFVSRDGTDYGLVERDLAEKVSAVKRQLAKGEVRIVFDPESESVQIVLARDLPEANEM